MTFVHEAIAALPTSASADRALIRAMVERRFAYCLAASESATNFVAVDPDTAAIPLFLIQNSVLFQYDATDSTTVHDGVTCLVTSDGKRYKSATFTTDPRSVLTKGTVAQPGSPSVGDRYLIPAAATGTDWAGQDNKVGEYTLAGWFFSTIPIGRFLYVRDETAFYHRNASGVWTAGVGSVVLGASTVPITAVIGANASFTIRVENQTTNAPPASPVAPVAYIIGPVPTGSWAGNPGKLAICLTSGSYTIITPATGDVVYDKARAILVKWSGTAWESASGAFVFADSQFTAAAYNTRAGSGFYSYSDTVAPTVGVLGVLDSVFITRVAKAAGTRTLWFRYSARTQIQNVTTSGRKDIVVGLFYDSVSAAIAWADASIYVNGGSTEQHALFFEFVVDAIDTLTHDYKIKVLDVNGSVSALNVSRRLFTLQEKAA